MASPRLEGKGLSPGPAIRLVFPQCVSPVLKAPRGHNTMKALTSPAGKKLTNLPLTQDDPGLGDPGDFQYTYIIAGQH